MAHDPLLRRLVPDSQPGNGAGSPPLIRHASPGLRPPGTPEAAPRPGPAGNGNGGPAPGAAPPRAEPRPLSVDDLDEEKPEKRPQIKSFDQALSARQHEGAWKRKPASTGQGACHVRSFHCKLTGDTLENLDRQINEWLDAHPDYEVKFATASIGDWTGKLKEPNLIVQVWV